MKPVKKDFILSVTIIFQSFPNDIEMQILLCRMSSYGIRIPRFSGVTCNTVMWLDNSYETYKLHMADNGRFDLNCYDGLVYMMF